MNANASFAVVNGGLDSANADASWTKVTREQVQTNTFTSARAASGTTSLDWFPGEWWSANFGVAASATVDPATMQIPTGASSSAFKPIPGAGQTFYLPWPALVVFTWSLVWGGEQWNQENPVYSALLIDKVYDATAGQQRWTGRSMWRTEAYGLFTHFGEVKNRHWNGHYTKSLGAGWHSAGIYLVCNGSAMTNPGSTVTLLQSGPVDTGSPSYNAPILNRLENRHIRTWARSFKHIAFRRG